MKKSPIKVIAILLCILLVIQQTGLAQGVAVELNIASRLAALHSVFTPDKFRPLHLRYISYDGPNNNFKLLLDKGDTKNPKTQDVEATAKDLLNYFFVGISLPNDAFWVNLRPDSPDNIIDPLLAQTEVGRILLESDLQLKKDTAKATSPETPEGREYWNKLYQKAGELYGSQNITIPTLTRPWIVPDEIIIGESADSAYVYKATLKVLLEEDYLKSTENREQSTEYSFQDPRLKELNRYSSQLIRELIIPKLIKDVNNAKRYASLRQVYYSLVLAQWFKARNAGKDTQYARLIDRKALLNLQSRTPYSVDTYFNAYKENFAKGEYNIKEPAYTPYGQVIRSYFSGGFQLGNVIGQPGTTIPVAGGGSATCMPEQSPDTGGGLSLRRLKNIGKTLIAALAVMTAVGCSVTTHPSRLGTDTNQIQGVFQLSKETLNEMAKTMTAEVIIAQMRSHLQYCDYYEADKSLQGLINLGPLAVWPLSKILNNKDEINPMRTLAATGLGKIGGKEAFESLVTQLNDKDVDIQLFVIRALGEIGREAVIGPLSEVLSDKEGYRSVRSPVYVRRADAAAAALAKINSPRAVKVLADFLNTQTDPELVVLTARSMSSAFSRFPQNFTENQMKSLFKFINIPEVASNIYGAFDNNRKLAVGLIKTAKEITVSLQKQNSLNATDFNVLIFTTSLEYVPLQLKGKTIKALHDFVVKEPSPGKRTMYNYSLWSAVERLTENEKREISQDKELSQILVNIQKSLAGTSEAPAYEAIERTKEFNIRLYTPLSPEIFDEMFENKGFSVKKEGEIIIYTKEINGIKVTVFCDPRGNPDNYKGQIFEDMPNPNIHMIAYSGHTGYGAALVFSFDKAPQESVLQAGRKIIALFSCYSSTAYLGLTLQHYPYSDFIGTTTAAYDSYDSEALYAIIDGVTSRLPWKDIKDRVEKRVAPEAQAFLFPHQPKDVKFVSAGGGLFGIGIVRAHNNVIFISDSAIVLTSENDSFDFEPGAVDVTKIKSNKVNRVISIVDYFLRWNEFLKDYQGKLKPSGFRIPYRDEQVPFFIDKINGEYEFSINAGYRNSSVAALTMIALYESNLYFAKEKRGKVTAMDQLRGLQLVATFTKYYHKEKLFNQFLQKYGYRNISLEDLLKSLDDHNGVDAPERIEVIIKLLKVLGQEDEGREALKAEGLLSEAPFNSRLPFYSMTVGDIAHGMATEVAQQVPERDQIRETEAPEQYIERLSEKYGVKIHVVRTADGLVSVARQVGIQGDIGFGFGHYSRDTNTAHVYVLDGFQTDDKLMMHEITEALARQSEGVAVAGAETGETAIGKPAEAGAAVGSGEERAIQTAILNGRSLEAVVRYGWAKTRESLMRTSYADIAEREWKKLAQLHAELYRAEAQKRKAPYDTVASYERLKQKYLTLYPKDGLNDFYAADWAEVSKFAIVGKRRLNEADAPTVTRFYVRVPHHLGEDAFRAIVESCIESGVMKDITVAFYYNTTIIYVPGSDPAVLTSLAKSISVAEAKYPQVFCAQELPKTDTALGFIGDRVADLTSFMIPLDIYTSFVEITEANPSNSKQKDSWESGIHELMLKEWEEARAGGDLGETIERLITVLKKYTPDNPGEFKRFPHRAKYMPALVRVGKPASGKPAEAGWGDSVRVTLMEDGFILIQQGPKRFKSERAFTPEEYSRFEKGLIEVAQGQDFSRTQAFNFSTGSEEIIFLLRPIITIDVDGTIINGEDEEGQQANKQHEEAHGLWRRPMVRLNEAGKKKEYLDAVVRSLQESGIWEERARHILEIWELTHLLESFDREKISGLQQRLHRLLRREVFNLESFLKDVENELGQEGRSQIIESILNEINSVAAEPASKSRISVIQAFRNKIRRPFEEDNAPVEVSVVSDQTGPVSTLRSVPKTTGGIDFRYLPIVTQSMSSLKASISAMPLASLERMNLAQEWADIERLVNSGITPSAERLKDYLAASCFKGSLDHDTEKIVACISDILRLEEESCCATDPALKDILVVLGSGRSSEELKLAFSGTPG